MQKDLQEALENASNDKTVWISDKSVHPNKLVIWFYLSTHFLKYPHVIGVNIVSVVHVLMS